MADSSRTHGNRLRRILRQRTRQGRAEILLCIRACQRYDICHTMRGARFYWSIIRIGAVRYPCMAGLYDSPELQGYIFKDTGNRHLYKGGYPGFAQRSGRYQQHAQYGNFTPSFQLGRNVACSSDLRNRNTSVDIKILGGQRINVKNIRKDTTKIYENI